MTARAHSADEDGLTLVELMVAMFFLSVAILSIASVAQSSLMSLRVSRGRQQATDAASAAIEDVRSLAYTDIVVLTSTVTAGHGLTGTPRRFDPDGAAAALASEEFVESTLGEVDFDTTAGTNNELRVRTYVTWADTARTSKRVTAVVTWTDRQVREVRQMTVVAPATRGLPAPQFSADPGSSFDRVSPTTVTPPDGCLSHTVRNIGGPDTYEWIIEVPGQTVAKITGSKLRVSNGWDAEAYLQITAGAASTPPALADLMSDSDGNGAPERNQSVGTGGTAYFTVCYTPSGVGVFNANPTFAVRLRSRFDPRVESLLSHEITAAGPRYALYTLQGGRYVRANLAIDTPLPPAGNLTDLDSNATDKGIAGMSMRRGQVADTLSWLWTLDETAPVVFDNARFGFWYAWEGELRTCGRSPPCDATAKTLTYLVTLEVLNANGTVATTVASNMNISVNTDGALGWQYYPGTAQLAAGTFTVQPLQQLRLRLSCAPAGAVSADDCHLAFGVTATPTGTPQVFQTNLVVSGP